jgi:hypothetical protein
MGEVMIKFLMSLFSRRFYETAADMEPEYFNAYLNALHVAKATDRVLR